MEPVTPFQTVGPFLSLGLRAGVDAPLSAGGPAIVIRGRLLDGGGQGIPDGVLEWWQPGASIVQRVLTRDDGRFELKTSKPTRTPAPDGNEQAPHLGVRVLGRGILTHYITRIYFADEQAANAVDPILSLVPEHRRPTIVAAPTGGHTYDFDVVVQGSVEETVFFDV